jgi:ribosomal protein S6--L-glutamate ligase
MANNEKLFLEYHLILLEQTIKKVDALKNHCLADKGCYNMKPEIGVIHPNPVPPPTTKHIITTARKMGYKTHYLRPQELSVEYAEGAAQILKGNKPIEVDIVFPRGTTLFGPVEQHVWRADIIALMEVQGIISINSHKSILATRDKGLAPILLIKQGIPVPPTLVTEDLNKAMEKLAVWGKAVVKPLMGSLGRGIFLVEDPDVAYPYLKQVLSLGQPLILQKFIRKKHNRDIRVITINNEVFLSYYRIGKKDSFKTNLAQGGRVELAKISEEIQELAIKTSTALGLFYAGVDIAENENGEYFVLEANASPNWRGAIELGFNPAKKLVSEAVMLARK